MAARLICQFVCFHGLYSLSGMTSYRKISWSLEAARFEFKIFQSLWNLAGTSAALLLRCLSNFRAIRPLQHPISRLRDFGGKTSYHLVNRGPGPWFIVKMLSHRYRKSHCGDKTIVRSSYLHNGISYAGKMTSLYWIRALASLLICYTLYVFLQVKRFSKAIRNTPHEDADGYVNDVGYVCRGDWC